MTAAPFAAVAALVLALALALPAAAQDASAPPAAPADGAPTVAAPAAPEAPSDDAAPTAPTMPDVTADATPADDEPAAASPTAPDELADDATAGAAQPAPARAQTENAGASEPEPRTLTVGVLETAPGFSTLGPFGLRTGFDVDTALALCERLSAECTIRALPASEIFRALVANQTDFAVAAVAPRGEASDEIRFTEPYLELTQRFVVPRENAPRPLSDDETPGAVRAAIAGTAQADHLAQVTTSPDSIALYGDSEAMWLDLAMGRLDAALVLGVTARREFLGTPVGDAYRFVSRIKDIEAGESSAVRIAVSASEAGLLEELDEAIAAFLASEEYERFLRRHLDADLARRPTPPAPD